MLNLIFGAKLLDFFWMSYTYKKTIYSVLLEKLFRNIEISEDLRIKFCDVTNCRSTVLLTVRLWWIPTNVTSSIGRPNLSAMAWSVLSASSWYFGKNFNSFRVSGRWWSIKYCINSCAGQHFFSSIWNFNFRLSPCERSKWAKQNLCSE